MVSGVKSWVGIGCVVSAAVACAIGDREAIGKSDWVIGKVSSPRLTRCALKAEEAASVSPARREADRRQLNHRGGRPTLCSCASSSQTLSSRLLRLIYAPPASSVVRSTSDFRRAPFSGLVLVLGLRPPSAIVALMSRRLPSSVSNDIKQFLAGYPNRKSSNASANLAFYQDEGPARPSRSSYTDLLRELKGNWTELEYQHGFIQVVWCIPDVRKPSLTSRSSPQWLFPIQEKGMYVAWTVGGHRPTMHTYSRTE